MNQIRAIQALNKKEIENGISPNASWHVDYRDTAYVYFGGLPFELTEGDIITIFSQFGEPTFLKLMRDKETGKSKGFGWLKYEDQRSTDLAVDNLGGATIGGRMVRVDHARYKLRDDEDGEEYKVGWEDMLRKEGKPATDETSEDDEEAAAAARPMLPAELELSALMREHDDDDPMKGFLIEEKKKEVEEARREAERMERKHRHKSRHSHHRSRRDRSGERGTRRPRRDRSRSEEERRGGDKERRSERRRDDSRDHGRRRRDHMDEGVDGSRRRHDKKDDRGRVGDRDRARQLDDRDRSGERRHKRRRDDDDRPRRRGSRSRSP